ncbi:hypothetical protein OPIT5_05885 [Opitutaceae bacterium TAV5]|nr:hypothetical protein OPIT5_05885 [Opitutaceae bacterium TAV5]
MAPSVFPGQFCFGRLHGSQGMKGKKGVIRNFEQKRGNEGPLADRR